MTAEEKVFGRKRFSPSRAEDFGFLKTDGGYKYEDDIMDGDFHVTLTVTDGGVRGTVVDRLNDEEYLPLRAEGMGGAYVNTVRSAYEELLGKVAAGCFDDVPFTSDQANRITAKIGEFYGVAPDFPWSDDPYDKAGVFRHTDNRKWFALIMRVRRGSVTKEADDERIDVMNLKIDPADGEALRKIPGVFPAFHMNHKSWISVTLDGTLSDDGVMELIDKSFELTASKKRKAK